MRRDRRISPCMVFPSKRNTWTLSSEMQCMVAKFLNVVILLSFLYLQCMTHIACSPGTVDPNLPYGGTWLTCYTTANITWAKQRQLSGLYGEYGSFGCTSTQGRAIFFVLQPVGCSYVCYVIEDGLFDTLTDSCINHSREGTSMWDERHYPRSISDVSRGNIIYIYGSNWITGVLHKWGPERRKVNCVYHYVSHVRYAVPNWLLNYTHLNHRYTKHRRLYRQVRSFSYHEKGYDTCTAGSLIRHKIMSSPILFTYPTLCNPSYFSCYYRYGTFMFSSTSYPGNLLQDAGHRNLAGGTSQDIETSRQAEVCGSDKSHYRCQRRISNFHPDSLRICAQGHDTNVEYDIVICVPLGFSPAFLCVEHCSGYSIYLACPSDIYGWTGYMGYLFGIVHTEAFEPLIDGLVNHRLRSYGCTLCGAWGRDQCLKSHLRAFCTTEMILTLCYSPWFHPIWGHGVDYYFDLCVNHQQWMAKFRIRRMTSDLVALLSRDYSQYSLYWLGFILCIECKESMMSCNQHRRVQPT